MIMIWLEILKFVIGLSILLWGANRLVKEASTLAKKLGVHPIIIGITVLSIGTSIPEIASSVMSFIQGHADVAVGNVIGSEFVQITLILGLVALIAPMKGKRKDILFYGVSMVVAILLAVLVISDHSITWFEGVFLVVAYILFLSFIVKRDHDIVKEEGLKQEKESHWAKMSLFMMIGITFTILGANLTVNSTVAIAKWFDISEYIISFFLIGLGTSLPELVVSGIAAWKGQFGMSLGDLLGSNITDPTLSLGLGAVFTKSAAISPVTGPSIIYLLVSVIFILGFFAWRKKIPRWFAAFMILMYVASIWII